MKNYISCLNIKDVSAQQLVRCASLRQDSRKRAGNGRNINMEKNLDYHPKRLSKEIQISNNRTEFIKPGLDTYVEGKWCDMNLSGLL